LVGYLSIPKVQDELKTGKASEGSLVKDVMFRFDRRKGKVYKVITLNTPLEELEDFFNGGLDGREPQDFAVVTDHSRRFVLGVVTQSDLEEFAGKRGA